MKMRAGLGRVSRVRIPPEGAHRISVANVAGLIRRVALSSLVDPTTTGLRRREKRKREKINCLEGGTYGCAEEVGRCSVCQRGDYLCSQWGDYI